MIAAEMLAGVLTPRFKLRLWDLAVSEPDGPPTIEGNTAFSGPVAAKINFLKMIGAPDDTPIGYTGDELAGWLFDPESKCDLAKFEYERL